MAISNRARAQLDAFAEEAERAAHMDNEPWRMARLEASANAVRAGDPVVFNWAAPAVLPVFLRVGAAGPWERVDAQGRREVRVALDDLAVALRVGPRIARELVVRALVPPPALELFPGKHITAPFGGAARLEIYASHVREVLIREHGDAWSQAPANCAIEFADVVTPRQLEVRVTGWEGTVITQSICVDVAHEQDEGLFSRMLREAGDPVTA